MSKKMIFAVLVIFVVICTTGCGSDKSKLVGKWVCTDTTYDYDLGKDDVYEFFGDGTGLNSSMSFSSIPFTWKIDKKNSEISMICDYPYDSHTVRYSFDGDILVIYDYYDRSASILGDDKDSDEEQSMRFIREE